MSCEVPIVAAVNGPAVGLGATLVLLCDLVVASSRAELAFVSFGDFPLSQSLRPPVSYVDHDPRAIGRAAMRRVLEAVRGLP